MKALTDVELEWLLEGYRQSLARGSDDMLQLANVDLRHCHLAERDLRRVALIDADLSECDLRGTRLGGARLVRVQAPRADLTASSLSEASFTDVDLRGARLDDANLAATEFLRTDLADVTMDRAVLTKAYIIDCPLDGATLREVHGLRLVILQGSMRNVDVRGAIFDQAIFRGVNLDGTDLSKAIIQPAVLLS